MKMYRGLTATQSSSRSLVLWAEPDKLEAGLGYYRLRMTAKYYDWLVTPPKASASDEEKAMWASVNKGALLSDNKATKITFAPTPLDFMYDVEVTVARTLPRSMLADFYEAYTTTMEHEVDEQVERVFGERRHNVEHIVGQAFIDRWLTPKLYFITERKWRDG